MQNIKSFKIFLSNFIYYTSYRDKTWINFFILLSISRYLPVYISALYVRGKCFFFFNLLLWHQAISFAPNPTIKLMTSHRLKTCSKARNIAFFLSIIPSDTVWQKRFTLRVGKIKVHFKMRTCTRPGIGLILSLGWWRCCLTTSLNWYDLLLPQNPHNCRIEILKLVTNNQFHYFIT